MGVDGITVGQYGERLAENEDSLGWQDPRTCVDLGLDYGNMQCALCGPSFASCKEIGLKPALLEAGAVSGRAQNDVWMLSGNRAYHYDGSSWLMTAMPDAGFSAIWVDPTGRAWVAGTIGDVALGEGAGQIEYWNGTGWTITGTALHGAACEPITAVRISRNRWWRRVATSTSECTRRAT